MHGLTLNLILFTFLVHLRKLTWLGVFFLMWLWCSLLNDYIVLNVELIVHIYNIYFHTFVGIIRPVHCTIMLASSSWMAFALLRTNVILVWRDDSLDVEKLMRNFIVIILHIRNAINAASKSWLTNFRCVLILLLLSLWAFALPIPTVQQWRISTRLWSYLPIFWFIGS